MPDIRIEPLADADADADDRPHANTAPPGTAPQADTGTTPRVSSSKLPGGTLPTGKVLVLGSDTRSFLAIVRSLGRHGIAVHAAPANFRSPALRSRYIAAIHDLPPWMADGSEWLAAIHDLLRREAYDLVIPCDETALLPLQTERARLAPLARLAIPNDRAIAVLFDKLATRKLAAGTGVNVAPGRLLRPEDGAGALLHEFGAPLVVKPRHSYALELLGARGKAQVVHDAATLARLLPELDPAGTLVEGFFPGQGLGVSVLASGGRILQAFEHHRVRERAGASFYRVSAPLTPALVQACQAMLAALSYTGLAMFEFRRNEAGDWILLEVNARPWGSMPLPVALGIDFPYRWYRLLSAGDETPPVAYRTGIYGRNLVPDLYALKAEAEERPGIVARSGFLARHAAEMLRVATGRERLDVLTRDDPWPGLAELGTVGQDLAQRMARQLPGAAARRRRAARAQVARAVRQAQGQLHICFACQGNICRSPFAEGLLRAQLDDGPASISSAGTIPRPGRASPPEAVCTAARFGVDLSAHRSAWLSREAANAASLLVVFDEVNLASLRDRHPDVMTPVICLADLTDPGEIADPIGGDEVEFARCYAQIAEGVAELVQLLACPAGASQPPASVRQRSSNFASHASRR